MIDTVLSDLFFNYGPAERAYSVIDGRSDDLGNDKRLFAAAADFLSIVGDRFGDVSARDLVDDFYNRL